MVQRHAQILRWDTINLVRAKYLGQVLGLDEPLGRDSSQRHDSVLRIHPSRGGKRLASAT